MPGVRPRHEEPCEQVKLDKHKGKEKKKASFKPSETNASAPLALGVLENLQDGRGVRRGDHLPPHRYSRNTSTRGTTSTEHLLNAGRRPQTSQKARNSPHTWVGQKKKEKNRDERIGTGPAPVGGSCEGGKVSTH